MTTEAEGRALLDTARAALEEVIGGAPSRPHREAPRRPGACFVTLTRAGELRGCIGTIEAHRPLADDARENALAAALRDPRFPPLTERELAEVSIELSVLSVPEPLPFADEADLLGRLRPGRDGLILVHGPQRGVFLPAVWRNLPTPATFLRQLKVKAGLAEDFWSPRLEVQRFETTSFREPVAAGLPTPP